MCSTGRVPVTSVLSSRGSIELTLDGLTFVRTRHAPVEPAATSARETVEWSLISGATLTQSRNGRPVVWIQVIDVLPVEHHRDDRYALKLRRKDAENAQLFIDEVNEEIAIRGRWTETG